MITTGTAFAMIRAGKIQQHRQWMTRSFAVALVFLEVRVISGLGGWDRNISATETIVWICLAFSLLLGDLVLQVEEYLRSRPVRRVQAVAAD
jgi:uncharacterized membrane protein YozB (DUF420 family)